MRPNHWLQQRTADGTSRFSTILSSILFFLSCFISNAFGFKWETIFFWFIVFALFKREWQSHIQSGIRKKNENKTHSMLGWRSKWSRSSEWDREKNRKRNGENQTENLVQRLCQHIKTFISAKSVGASMNLMLKIEFSIKCKSNISYVSVAIANANKSFIAIERT